MIKIIISGAAAAALFATPAMAEVKTVADQGFSTLHAADVLAKPEDVWKRLLAPKDWWNPAHSWSGSTDGFYIDPQAGGCFCELFQEKDKDGKLSTKGSVEHMRVIFSQPAKVLRMQGSLGPLQAEAATGTLTIAMEPLKDGAGTRVSFSYVVGGYMRFKTADIGPAVDAVLREQFDRMIKPLGKVIGNDTSETPDEGKKAGPKASSKADPKKAVKKPDLDAAVDATEPEPKVGKPEKVEADDAESTDQPE
ncbi:MAG: hypothetical protein IPM67_13170 [Sphingomonadales bacterium]|jgi:hypothetical protein|nr:hypothetical protein [Sphingomonadales bacterium]MBK9269572.1 hypothetical protein [Sphingomonadales bacterium]